MTFMDLFLGLRASTKFERARGKFVSPLTKEGFNLVFINTNSHSMYLGSTRRVQDDSPYQMNYSDIHELIVSTTS